MKKQIIGLIVIVLLGLNSCKKTCNCTESWDSSNVYVEGDLVEFNGKCWEAVAQGRGITPGPWQQNGNDIWQECIP